MDIRDIRRQGSILLLLLGGALAAAPATSADTAPAAGAIAPLDRRVSVNLERVRPSEAFRTFAELAGCTVAVDAALAEPITVRLENVRIQTVLDAVCEGIGCSWELAGTPPVLHVAAKPLQVPKPAAPEVRPGDPVDLKIADGDVHGLLRTLANLLDADLVLDPAVQGKVTITASGLPLQRVLDNLCQQVHCAWILGGGDNGGRRTLKVIPKKP